MPKEDDDFDAEALNEGLNADPEPDDPYANKDPEPEEDAANPDSDPEPDDEPEEKPLTRGQARIQALANEKAQLAAERASEKAARELAEQRASLLERQLQEAQRSQKRAEEDENLTDLEKWQRNANEEILRNKQEVLRSNAMVADMADKSDFLMAVSGKPHEMALAKRVEDKLAEARKNGFNPKREDVLIRLMGEDARKKANDAPAVKRDAADRVKAAAGKPLGSKSNVAKGKTEETEEDRLKGITL